MDRADLLVEVRDLLARTGFYVAEGQDERGLSFDLIARRDDLLLLIKILTNVDAFGTEAAQELGQLAVRLRGSPLLVGVRGGGGDLEPSVVYSRFGIPIVSMETLRDLLVEGVPPYLFSAPGGLYVRLDEDVLRRAREDRGLSLGSLAEAAGVSRRAVQMYLEGMRATLDIALRLEEFLGESLLLPVDPLAVPQPTEAPPDPAPVLQQMQAFERRVLDRLVHLGFAVMPTPRSPFEAFAEDRDLVYLTGVARDERATLRKARALASVARVAEKDAVFFVERRYARLEVSGAPLVARAELEKATDSDSLGELIEARKRT